MLNDSSKSAEVTEKPAVPWGPLTAVMAFIGFMSAQFIVGILLGIGLALAGWSGERIETWFAESISAQFIYVILFESLSVGILLAYLRRRKVSLRVLGFKKPKISFIGWAVLGYLVYFGLFVVLSTIFSSAGLLDVEQKQELLFDAETTTGLIPLAIAFVSLVVLPPIVEEMMFRGFIFSGMLRRFGIIIAILLTSILFAAPHMMQSSEGVLWVAGLDTFLLSLVLCTLRIRTGTIWASVLVHGIKNSLAFVALFILHVT